MKPSLKNRVLAVFLAVVMLFTMMPVVNVFAADPTGTLSVSNLSVTYNKDAGNASSCKLSGTTITATAESGRGLGANAAAGKTTVTLKNTGSTNATLSFSYIGKGVASLTIDGVTFNTGSGSFSKALGENKTAVIVFTSENGGVLSRKTATLTIENVSLSAEKDVNVTFKKVSNGSYTVDNSTINADTVLTKKSTESFAVTASPSGEYNFVGWYNETADEYISYDLSATFTFDGDAVVYPVFVSKTVALFGVGKNRFADLTEACNYATASKTTTVVLLNSGTVSGNHTIPKDVTLLVSMDTNYTPMGSSPEYTTAYTTPSAFLTLTLTDGAKITVNGSIEAEAVHTSLQGSPKPRVNGGRPCGKYGAIYMSPGSNITLNSGSALYAWGYVYGEGSVTANSGSKVYEYMQVTDFPGGSNLTMYVDTAKDADGTDEDGNTVNDYVKSFPFSQYYVQNIEVPLTINSGATEYVYTTVTVNSNLNIGMPVEFIGSDGMFIPSSGSVIKDYNPSTDRLIFDLNGEATVNSIVLDMSDNPLYAIALQMFLGTTKFDSSMYILGLNGNITINVNSGSVGTIGQDVALFPGTEIYIDNGATLVIAEGKSTNITVYGSGGNNVYAYDLDQWGNRVFSNSPLIAASYSPTAGRYKRTASDLKDAKIDINGTVITNGYLYSTVTLDDNFIPVGGGAEIISSEKTGKIQMMNGAGIEEVAYSLDGSSNKDDLVYIDSAWLKNGDGSFLLTDGAEAETTFNYCATHDKWYTGECEECNAAPIMYEITWNYNGKSETAEVEEGTVPSFPGAENPTKSADKNGHYTFAGWSESDGGEAITLPKVTGDATYYAVFTAEKHIDNIKDTAGDYHLCDVCSYNMGSHYDTDSIDHYCDDCNKKMSEHEGGTATCKTQAVCSKCKKPYGELAKHSYKAVVTSPTCTEGGYTTYTCTVCGDSYKADEVAANGHKYNGVVTAPTCLEPGYTTYTCSVCGDDYKADEVIAKGHDYDDGVIVDEPTCNDEGLKKFTCGACGDSYTEAVSAKGHTKVTDGAKEPDCENTGLTEGSHCSECGTVIQAQQEVPALGHDYDAVVTAPTCTEGGYTTYTCSVCGDSYVADEVAAKGHDYDVTYKWEKDPISGWYCYGTATCACSDVKTAFTGAASMITKEATCTENGTKLLTATIYADWATTQTKTETIPALGHKYGKVVTAPTCTEDGYTTYTCSVCGDTYKADEVTADGHKYDADVKEPTCTEGGYTTYTCSVCGDTYTDDVVPENGHDYEADVKAPTCTEGGFTTYTCSVCGDTYTDDVVPENGHDYEADVKAPTCTEGGYTTYTCSVCGDSYVADEVAASGHSYDAVVTEPTCIEGGYTTYTCSACGDSYTADETESKGHDWDDGVISPEPTCNDAGVKTFTCGTCGDSYTEAVSAKGHTEVTDEAQEPDCENTGLTEGSHCSECGTVIEAQQEVPALGHDYDADVTEPTCTAGGYTTHTCSVCGDTYVDDEVSALGHGSVDGFTYTDLEDGKHSVTCKDCGVVTEESVAHIYDENTYECVCKAVKTFKLEYSYFTAAAEEVKEEVSVPYGAELSDYLPEVEDHTFDDGLFEFKSWDNLPEKMPAEDISIKAVYYRTGWLVCDAGTAYEIRNEIQKTGWTVIEDAWYYLDTETGLRAEGITRVPYPGEEIDGVKYEADKETLDYCESKGKTFIDATSGLFLFGEDGKFENTFTGITEYKNVNRYIEKGFMPWNPGLVEAEGELYYFVGDGIEGGNTPANGDVYIIRANGIDGFKENDVYNFKNGQLSGVNGVANGKYYENSKLITGKGLTAIEVDGETKYIYVRYTGEIIADAEYWIGDNKFDIVPGLYAFDADGYMIDVKTTDKEGIFFEDGGYYFYENGVRAYKGLINYTGKANNGTVYENDWIYVRSSGQLATGEYWTTKNDSELKTQTYIFDETGKMVRTDGIIEENGNLYYYVSGIKQKGLGLIELEGKFYYVRTAGELVRGREYWITNANETGVVAQNYYFDNDGVMQNPVYSKSETVNGVVDGYYYEDGKIAYGAGLVELNDGSIIYVRSNGQLATGIYWPTTLNGVLPAGKYDFGTDGRLIVK